MKKLFIAVLSMAVISLHAQSADEVIQKYTANMGGLEAFNKITSAKITGTVTAAGKDLPMVQQIINGKGWKLNPFQGAPVPTEVTGAELNDFKMQSSLASPLMDYKARGHQVEILGQETLEGIKTYKIKLTSKDDGRVTTYFISTADYTLIKSATNRTIQGKDTEVESWYSELIETGGLKFFMTRSAKINGAEFQNIKYEKIELNVPVDEKIFEMN